MNDLTLAAHREVSPRRRHRGRWTLLLIVAALFVATCLTWQWIAHGTAVPVSIVVDGQPWSFDGDVAALPWTDQAAVAFAIAVTLVAIAVAIAVTLVVVPLALGVALFAVILALLLVVLLGVGLPLLLGGAVLLVVLSPLWLLAWLLWRALRPRRSATIAT